MYNRVEKGENQDKLRFIMKNSDRIKCPHCNEETIVKIRQVMDGWQSTGREFYCMLCSQALGEARDDDIQPAIGKAPASGLAALFGGDTEQESAPVLETAEDEGHFCRDCRFCILHPFYLRCGKFHRETDPMDDCGDFEKRDANS